MKLLSGLAREVHGAGQFVRQNAVLSSTAVVLGGLLCKEAWRSRDLLVSRGYVTVRVREEGLVKPLVWRMVSDRRYAAMEVRYRNGVRVRKKEAVKPGNATTPVVFDGMRVWLSVHKVEATEEGDADTVQVVLKIPRAEYDRGRLEAFFANLVRAYDQEHLDGSNANIVQVFRWQYSEVREKWTWIEEKPVGKRSFDTMVGDSHARVVEDVRQFVADKAFYADNGMPHKRTYILHGPAGTGKTTLIRLIATMFQKTIFYLDLSHRKMSDDSLVKALVKMPSNALVVIEDINRSQIAPFNDSTLLNVFDGINSSGNIIFITTNDLQAFRDFMPSAFFRPGRVDMIAELGYASESEVREYVNQFFTRSLRRTKFSQDLVDIGEAFGNCARAGHISIATVQKYCIEHRGNPRDALQAFRKAHAPEET